ncbi:uncharacterized protein PADG_02650 [Paracoccidioides brasiliensis Pb18]|uniref:MARVEL domain-containing protein n=2 Tax=Paracoccidioides brasiliensis TaxID=121759 RepID=C1G645_PARBD|nr:uncharacterized protein PADG_02650 [Paracoccidioides brasiliensis Pb18]EEH46552.2 hypothetical protein PADG_02650 [Paracoccidioides brasiliensis Pb18]ODH44329.1 hypothetical protein ACO22_00862 [Paracoccidioides brasiliensis]ODH52189.1 hypothetical protein GX48_01746 [Paracoccidioides brasiliensis]
MFSSFHFPRMKMLLHGLQGFVVFLGWALTVAVFTRDGDTDGRTAYYFALCWLTAPALVYLAAVPMWPRTRRFGNAYAFAAIDVLFAVLWFASWVAVASYVGAGKKEGEKDKKNKDRNGCDAFAFGSPAKCRLSTGTAVLGVGVCLLFIATSYLSIRNLIEYRRSGTMPYEGSDPTFAAHSKAAFSSNPAQDFDDEDDRDAEFRSGRSPTAGAFRRDPNDAYALLHNNDADDLGALHGTAVPPPLYDPTSNSNSNSNSNNNNNHGNILTSPPPLPVTGDSSYLHDYDTSYRGAYGAGHGSQASGSYQDGHPGR